MRNQKWDVCEFREAVWGLVSLWALAEISCCLLFSSRSQLMWGQRSAQECQQEVQREGNTWSDLSWACDTVTHTHTHSESRSKHRHHGFAVHELRQAWNLWDVHCQCESGETQLLSVSSGGSWARVVKVSPGPLIRVEGQPVSIRCDVSEYGGPREQVSPHAQVC